MLHLCKVNVPSWRIWLPNFSKMKIDRSWTEINLANYRYNLQQLRKIIPPYQKIMQIVKADAYGHGALQIAKEAEKNGVAFLGVANQDEGAILRYQGIKLPILILSPSLEDEIPAIIENNLIPTIFSLDFAERLNSISSKPIKAHINIDTGMGRSGFNYEKFSEINYIYNNLTNIEIDGVFSHFASSENNQKYTEKQKEIFYQILEKLDFSPKYIHLSNSSGAITTTTEKCNLVRIGLLAFGVYTDCVLKKKINLKPVMNFKTTISQIKEAKAGQSIGYNQTYITPKETKYAILPVGYADGYDYLLSNKGSVEIKQNTVPVIGKISMDMTAIDISGIDCQIGDEVTLLGDSISAIRAENIVKKYDGSAYELLCQIGRRAKRYYHYDGLIIDSSPLLRRDFFSADFSDVKLNTIIESAMQQRMQSKQMAELLYSEILKQYFIESDNDIHYRRDFKHKITLQESAEFPKYYKVSTELKFTKILTSDYFLVACANSEENLEKYFKRKDVEYRWLLDEKFKLDANSFSVYHLQINSINLSHRIIMNSDCMEIYCSAPELKDLIGQEVQFSISTSTYYPKDAKYLSVYIIEMTKGVEITLESNIADLSIDAVPIFSGKNKFPKIDKSSNMTSITSNEHWVFPTSGVIFIL